MEKEPSRKISKAKVADSSLDQTYELTSMETEKTEGNLSGVIFLLNS